MMMAGFCLSGLAALIYEIVWTRVLSLVMGSTVYALSTMLATIMAGLAIGGVWGGRLADRTGRHLALFAFFELIIGVMGILSVPLMLALLPFYQHLYAIVGQQEILFLAVQVLSCAMLMIIPTTLMGATFPLVSRYITEHRDETGREVGTAFSVNTIGAVCGSLSAGFFLIPIIGVKGAAFLAGGVNVVIALGIVSALKISRPRR